MPCGSAPPWSMRCLELTQLAGDELAIEVPRIGRVEQITGLEEQVNSVLERVLNGLMKAAPQMASALLEPLGRHAVVVAIQVVVGSNHCGYSVATTHR